MNAKPATASNPKPKPSRASGTTTATKTNAVIPPAATQRFRWDDRPVSGTAFFRRFCSALELAFEEGTWVVMCAQPGDGKSTAIEGFMALHPRFESVGATKVPIFSTRVPQGPKTALALMLAFASDLGRVPKGQKGTRLQRWLYDTAVASGVRLIIIDDAHELSMAQLNWLREFTGSLALAGVRPGLVLSAAVLSIETSRLPLWAKIDTVHDTLKGASTPSADEARLTGWQFFRRLDGQRPLVLVPAHSKREVAEILTEWQRRYRPLWPNLRLNRWAKSLFVWCRDTRIDVAEFKLVNVNALARIVREGLEDEMRAGGDGSGDSLGDRLRSAAIRQMGRGTSFTVLTGDPKDGTLRFVDGYEYPGDEDETDAA